MCYTIICIYNALCIARACDIILHHGAMKIFSAVRRLSQCYTTVFCCVVYYFQQRLTDEAEMTEGFKTLLKDLHQLMRNIKDSSVMLKRGGSPVEYVVPDKIEGTIEDGFPGKSDGRNTTATVQGPNDESSRSRDDNVTADTLATTEIHAVNSLPGPSTKPKKNGGKELKKKKRASKSLATHAPLHSSSPKRTSPVLDNDGGNEYTAELDYPYSDISDVGSDHDEYRPERNPKLTPKEPNSRFVY